MFCLMLAVALAPLLFGSVTTEAQGGIAILLGISLWFTSRDWKQTTPLLPRWVTILFTAGLVLCLVPLPFSVVKLLSPSRAALATQFPLNPDSTVWSTLTISPAMTLRWFWQFFLLFTAFSVVRQLIRRPGGMTWLIWALVLGIAGQIAAEIYFGGASERMVLGLWPVRWGNSSGTFANRNHYAGWLMMAALVLAALSIRGFRPLRSSRPEAAEPPAKRPALAWAMLAVSGAAMIFALMSGSRSGLLALLTGGVMLVLGLKQHSVSRRRGFLMLLMVLLLALSALPFAGHTLDRLSKTKDETSSSYAKWRLWEDAARTFAKFPVVGTGPGTFVRSNILYKSAGGESTAWHAENDLLQWFSETGLWGMVVLGACGFFFWQKVGKWFWSPAWKTTEPELALGAFAGLVGIMTHSLFDFPWQVMANALLGVVLLGVILGLRDAGAPEAEYKLASRTHGRWLAAGGLALAIFGVLPILSFREYREAQQKDQPALEAIRHARHAMQLWPLNTERAIAWLRLNVAQLSGKPQSEVTENVGRIRHTYTRYLKPDPLDWELRLERAWLDVAFLKDRQVALKEARMATGLNPKQAMIPLRFAEVLANRDPEKAWDFLLAADVTQERLLKERLEIGWQIRQDATQLWSLIPATDGGYAALAEFAFSKNLPGLAQKAYERMRIPPSAIVRSQKFMDARRPDLALKSLPELPGNVEERIAMAKVHLQLGNTSRSLLLLEPVFEGKAEWQRSVAIESSDEALLRVWKSGDHNARIALQLAEVLTAEAPDRRDMALLQQIYSAYPGEKRLLWLLYRTRLDRHEFKEAARLAITLAERIATSK